MADMHELLWHQAVDDERWDLAAEIQRERLWQLRTRPQLLEDIGESATSPLMLENPRNASCEVDYIVDPSKE
jgi:hypothetical protein